MNIDDETQLPPLWNRFANAKTKDRVFVLQTAVDMAKQALGSSRLDFLASTHGYYQAWQVYPVVGRSTQYWPPAFHHA